MKKKSRALSLRTSLLLLVMSSILITLTLMFLFFKPRMSSVLLETENKYIMELGVGLKASFETSIKTIRSATHEWSNWDETYAFLEGEHSGYIDINNINKSLLRTYNFNYVLIKDADNQDKYVYSYDFVHERAISLPDGFSQELSKISERVFSEYALHTGSYGKTGVLLFNDVAYLVCVAPVVDSNETLMPNGTFSFAVKLENYLRTVTNVANSKITVNPQVELGDTLDEIVQDTDQNFMYRYNFNDIYGNPIYISMKHIENSYTKSMNFVDVISSLLFFTIFTLLILLYLIIQGYMLNPVIRLNQDVRNVFSSDSGTGLLDKTKYGNYREVSELATEINGMVQRIDENRLQAEQTKLSITVMQNILNGIDAYIYVSDVETDEILFINDKMREHYKLPEDVVGQTCWKVLQEGFTERCSFCPNHKLKYDHDGVVQWEEHSTVTGRYYRNVDRHIDWVGDKKVHLQHSTDVTDIMEAEIVIQKRLEQQELMAALSQIFISGTDSQEMIMNALEMTGEFMDIGRVALLHTEGGALSCSCEWVSSRAIDEVLSKKDKVLSADSIEMYLAKKFAARSIVHYNLDEEDREEISKKYSLDATTFLSFPLFVGNQFWGILEFDQRANYKPWTTSDINLGEMITGLLSGAITRQMMEGQITRISSIVESSPQYIAFLSAEGVHEYINPATVAVTGYTQEEVLEGGLPLMFSEESVRFIQNEALPKVKARGKFSFELPLHHKDKSKRIMSFSVFMLPEGSGGGVGVISRDMTEIRRLENDLIKAKELAEQGSMAKGEFLSRMSHEMRTPMNAIIGMANIARSSTDPERKEYCLEKISDASTHLLGVINDILDMSKIEANKFELSDTDFSFEKMLMKVVNVINFRIDEKRQNLFLNIDPQIPKMLCGDEQRLSQVVTNLLTNAAKFTPIEGQISLIAELERVQNKSIRLRIEITDTGIGISAEQQSRLFRSFEQADGGISRKFGGTGLGLAISKRIIELMGGEIWIESELGKGSKFIFTFEMRSSDAPSDLPEDFLVKDDLNVLVVDDSTETLEYFSSIMQQLGATRCSVAQSGAQALEMLASNSYDIIFVDWKMPEMNGVELTARIKELDNDINPVIIMISVAEWSEIEKDATEAGVTAFLAKPLFPSVVASCVNRYFGSEDSLSPIQEDKIYDFRGKRILLAEDVDINREIVYSLLEDTYITIDSAVNGKEAVEIYCGNADSYDLILMDIQMPEMDGYEATRQIRKYAKNVPIIAMTANAFREDVERCLEAGMNDHLAKPIEVDKLLDTLERYLLG